MLNSKETEVRHTADQTLKDIRKQITELQKQEAGAIAKLEALNRKNLGLHEIRDDYTEELAIELSQKPGHNQMAG